MKSEQLHVRAIGSEDPKVMAEAFARIGWAQSKPVERFEKYRLDQAAGVREVLVASIDDGFVGYATVSWAPSYPPFARARIPVIEDLNVLPPHRRRHVATRLVDDAEKIIAGRSRLAGIGVGLHPGYNAAHRMYVKRGYVPDGEGVSMRNVFVVEGQTVVMDDDLVLHLVKELR